MNLMKWASPQALMEAARRSLCRDPRVQVAKRQTRYVKTEGPMKFIGQQIVKQMQLSGRDAKISECLRTWQRQADLYSIGRTSPGRIVTKAAPGQSPHNYALAVDIIHPQHGWDVDAEYWDTLAASVRVVAQKYNVELNHGHNWKFTDSAHVELQQWRDFAAEIGPRQPSQDDLDRWFKRVIG